ncbi:hypothetical protein M422DRAFT_47281 [Sphaerobolus stellatus SS14]|uniref:Uncharacterized protein n=1 Tax=Sphaerobolus stellatus (strain SS14) TaxID=990650 RepID=A0A0C9UNF5_SPHS4|nr:hypothetical protein M422DRAFT_47281 [Sphaerobolus stellatus SS14]
MSTIAPVNPYKKQPKCLPWTTYVSSARYHTDLFHVRRWKDKVSSDTWESEIKQETQEWQDLDMIPLLIKVAKSVDYLEETVRDKHDLCSDLGLGPHKAKPINTISPQHLQKFLVTHVLDCLFWAAMPSQSSAVVQDIVHYKHPELAANHVRPQGGAAAVKYVALEEEDLNTLLDEFLNLIPIRLPAFMAPGLQPPSSEVVLDQSQGLIYMAHSGSAYSGPSAQQGGYLALQPMAPDIAQDQIVPWDQLQEPDQQYLGHATAGVSALNNAVVAKRHMAMANMWNQQPNYAASFRNALARMNIGPQARPFLEVFISSRDKDKLPTNSTRLTPASVALCHTPLYLLNPQIDMTRLDFPGRDLSIAKVINAAFTEPPALSARTKASEIMVWKCVGHMLRRIMPLGQPTDFQDHLGGDLQWQLFKDLYEAQKQPRQTLEHDIKEWPHMAQLPPRLEDVAAGKYKATEADTKEEQNSQGEPTTLPPSVVDNVNHELLMQVSELNTLDGSTQNVVNASTLEPVLSTVQLLPPGISPDATAGGGRPPPSLPSSGAQEGMLLPPPPSPDPHQPPPPKLPVPHTPNPTPGLLEQPAAGGKQSIPANLLSGMIASAKDATETQDLPLSHAPSRMPPTQGESVSSVIPSPLLRDPASNTPSSHVSSMPLHYPIRHPSPSLPHLTPTPPLPRPSTPEESHITGPALDAELAPLSPLTEFSDDNQEDQTVSAHFEEDEERELNENLLDLLGEYTGGGKSRHKIYDSSSHGARGQVEAGAESSVHVRQEDALRRSNRHKRTGHIPPAHPPAWILPKSKPRRGKRVVQTLDQHGASSKRRISEIESAEDVKPKRARGGKQSIPANLLSGMIASAKDATETQDLPLSHAPSRMPPTQGESVSSVIPSPLLRDPASNTPSSHVSSMPLHYPIRNPSPPLPHLTPTPPLPRPSTPEESHITGPALDAELAPLSPLTEFSDDNQEDQMVSAHFEEDEERELNENLLDLLGEYTGGGKSRHKIYDSSSRGARGQVEAGAESSVHVRQEDALRRSNRRKRTGHIPPAHPPTWILPKSKPRRGKRVVQTLDQHGASSKRRISEIESAEDVKPKRARGEKPGWNVKDTTYTLVNYINLTLLDDGDHTPTKLKDIRLSQVDAKAAQEIKAKGEQTKGAHGRETAESNLELPAPPEDVEMDIEENITVVRHALLEDGQIYREEVEFKMSWPAGMGADRKIFWDLWHNSQPAQVMNGAQIVDHVISKECPSLSHDSIFPPPTGNDLQIIPRSLFSDLEASRGKAEYKSLEERLATRTCLILPSTTREEVNSWYRQPILDVGDIVENLMIDVNTKREVHGEFIQA